MNILYLNNTMILGGGVQKCVYLLAKNFSEENKVIVASSGGEYVEELKDNNIEHIEIINPEKKDPISLTINIHRLYKLVKKNKIDIIHSHHRMTTLYARILSKLLNVKVTHTAHLYTTDKKYLTKWSLRNLPIISVSNGVRQGLIGFYGLNKNNIKTIYNTMEFNSENALILEKYKNELINKQFIVGVVSRLEPVKGIDIILEASKHLGEDIKIFIFGEGKLKEEFNKYITENNLSNVILMGKVSNISDYMKNFDVIIQSSYQEGLPLSLIEASYLGIPIIATNIPGTNEVVINDYNGILVEVGSSEEIKKAIVELYNNEEKRKTYSINSELYFKKNFSQKKYYTNHLSFYNSLLEKH